MPKQKFATVQDFYNEAINYTSTTDMNKKTNISMKIIWKYLVKLKKTNINLHKDLLDIWAYKREENLLNIHAFDEINEESAYWLGMLASDGCVSSQSNCISLTSKADDSRHLNAFKDFLKSKNKVSFYQTGNQTGKTYKAAAFRVSSKVIRECLSSFGIIPAKSNLDIDYLEYVPDEFKFAFIAGYFDGDGWICSNLSHKSIKILSNQALAKHINSCLNKVGVCSCVYKMNRKYSIDKFEICIFNKKSLENFCKAYLKLNEKFLLERKRNKIIEYLEDFEKDKNNKGGTCPVCGGWMTLGASMCVVCRKKLQAEKSARPPKDELEKLIYELSFVQIGKKYGVTDNAVRKWCKYYGLPYKKVDIKTAKNLKLQNK